MIISSRPWHSVISKLGFGIVEALFACEKRLVIGLHPHHSFLQRRRIREGYVLPRARIPVADRVVGDDCEFADPVDVRLREL